MDQIAYKFALRIQASGPACQDRAAIIELPQGLVLVLADGAGGMSGGAEAAEYVVSAAEKWVRDLTDLPDEADWCRWLTDIDAALEADPSAGETTAVCVSASDSGIMGASVGDSEAWVIGANGTMALTRGQRRKPLLGSGEAFPVPFSTEVAWGDLLIGSDGLFNYTSAEEIVNTLKDQDAERAAENLIALVRSGSGWYWDDVSVIVVQLVSTSCPPI